MRETTYQNLGAEHKQLLDEAARGMERAYNPYSHFYVGAALLIEGGKTVSASNVENAAYGSTICAERMALGKANSEALRKLRAVAIIGRHKDFDAKEIVAPCGACRQMLYEAGQVADYDFEVIMSNTKKDKVTIAKMSELLPLAFGPKDLGIDLGPWRQ